VPKCTNVSIGYYSEYNPEEALDVGVDDEWDFTLKKKKPSIMTLW